MKLHRGLIPALSGLLGLAAMLPAPALPATSCGGSWVGPVAECSFAFAGFPITITGVAYADYAAIVVTLVAEPEDLAAAPPVPLLVCAGVPRQDNVGCEESFGAEPVNGPSGLPVGVRLTCRVVGVNNGTFRCESGTAGPIS